MNPLGAALPRTAAVIRKGMQAGLHTGAQYYVSLGGLAVVDGGVGEARPGVPMDASSITPWLSSGKPLAAIAVARLWERERLRLDDAVASWLPGFQAGGKGGLTVRQVLTHTAGLHFADAGVRTLGPREALEHIRRLVLPPDWRPGERAAYSSDSGWYVLGELVRSIDGRDLGRYLREEIFLPLGWADSSLGIARDEHSAKENRIALLYDTSRREPRPLPVLNGAEACARIRPGGNLRGPIRDLGRLYEILLRGGAAGSFELLLSDTIRVFTSRQRVGLFDETIRHVMDWGLGFVPDNNRYGPNTVPYGYGPHASPLAFGHSGSQSSKAFADPAHGLAAAILFNGMPGDSRHQDRVRSVCAALYEDLGLGG